MDEHCRHDLTHGVCSVERGSSVGYLFPRKKAKAPLKLLLLFMEEKLT